MRKLLIWGASGHAKVVADAVRLEGRWQIAGFIDDVAPARRGEVFAGAEVLGGREVLHAVVGDPTYGLFLAFGNNPVRLALADELCAFGLEFATIVHPSSTVAPSARLGAGVFVGPGAVINADAWVGAQAIVNSGAVVEHDCVVGEGAHIGPRACLGGLARVGRACWIGAGAALRDRIDVGDGTMVGLGAVVVSTLPGGVVAYGCPARVVRKVEA